jgi:chromosome segregation ATPase
VADNSAALRHARRHDSRIKRQRAADAIHAFEHGGEPISFPAVARRAGVSVSLLYADPELAGRIAAVRDRQQQAGRQRAWHVPARSLVTEQSLRAELTNTKEQVRQLTEDVALLRERLAHQLGVDAEIARGWDVHPLLTQLERRAAELEADNHRLRRQVVQLDEAVRDLTDNLEAARTMNRDLMNELNRDTPPRRPRPASTEATRN